MASYGYGYGSFTSQPQQYSAGSFASQTAGSYGYASTQPVSRVVQGFQAGGTAAGYGQTYAQASVPAASSGGYGYFQRASDPGYGYTGTQVKATYSAGTTGAYQQKQTYVAATPATGYATTQRTTNSTPSYSTQAYQKPAKILTPAKSSGTSHQNAYEKVVYNAATSFLNQQATTNKGTWQKSEKPTFKLSNQKGSWAKQTTPKPQQLHYCEVCKISCAGPQTYKEHLEGQKHKKKAASQTSDTKKLPKGTFKCELCDVICTGRDAFAAHVKGASHTKTLKLHQKLGKPIPEIKIPEPEKKKEETETGKNVVKTTAPKINFVGGSKLASTGSDEKGEGKNGEAESQSNHEIPVENDPIGEEYVEEIKSDVGKIIGFKCTLCDCRFNDMVARSAHIKGRRHRVSYKKKVDPSLKVESKASGTRRGSNSQEKVWKQRQEEQMRWEAQLRMREEELRRWEHEEYMRRANEDRYWTRPDRNRMHELEYYEWERRERFVESQQNMFGPPQGPPPPTPDDRLIMAKHQEIYPTEPELKQVQTIVGNAEKALKLVSDTIGDGDKKPDTEEKKEEPKAEKAEEEKSEETSEDKKPEPLMKPDSNRKLKGIMRVGALAKGLLLRGQLNVELVVICAEKTTHTLLKKVGTLVPEKLKEVAPEEKYNMLISKSECAIIISSTTEPKCSVKVLLTSPAMRDDADEEGEKKEEEKKKEPVKDPKDVLDKEKSLQALAALRHAKWFQARANQLQSCVIVIRIFRDMRNRVPAFKPLGEWAIELLCEKALASSYQPMAPGCAFRRVLEAISSGVLMPGGSGVLDPCEKDKTDAVTDMTMQEREDITAAAQHALRLMAFRQLHKILGVEPLKPNLKRKRRQSTDASPTTGTGESESKVTKKE